MKNNDLLKQPKIKREGSPIKDLGVIAMIL